MGNVDCGLRASPVALAQSTFVPRWNPSSKAPQNRRAKTGKASQNYKGHKSDVQAALYVTSYFATRRDRTCSYLLPMKATNDSRITENILTSWLILQEATKRPREKSKR